MVDWDPDAYGRINTLQEFVAAEALSGLVLTGTERVLDVGCGDGLVSRLVADRLSTGTLLGIDPSAAMVEAARRRFAGRGGAEFAVATAATMPYRDTFDLVTSFNALHWETRWQQALERIADALVSPGRAFLVFVCAGDRPRLEDVVTTTSRSERWQVWFGDFQEPYVHVGAENYAGAARAAGFVVDRIEVADLSWDFRERSSFAAWCAAGLRAWTGRLPLDRETDFLDDVLNSYQAVSGSVSTLRFLQCRVALSR